MDIKKQVINEYLTKGFTYCQLSKKYGISRSTINTWELVHQGIHNLPRSKRQNSYDLQQMKQGKDSKQKQVAISDQHQKIALLQKQLAWEKIRADALDKMIDIAEKELIFPSKKACYPTVQQIIGVRQYSLQSLCHLFGYSRQAYYKQHHLQLQQQSKEALILQQVINIRRTTPMQNTKTAHYATTIFQKAAY
jgi:transposase-like protein